MKKIISNIKKIKYFTWKQKISYFIILLSLSIFTVDTIYKNINNINYLNKESCFFLKM